MRTWEYRFVHTARVNDIVDALNKAGKDGWEGFATLDAGHDYSVLMRRPVDISDPRIVLAGDDKDKPGTEERTDVIGRRLVPRIPPDPNVPWANSSISDGF